MTHRPLLTRTCVRVESTVTTRKGTRKMMRYRNGLTIDKVSHVRCSLVRILLFFC